jgi:hypothetical protein
MMYYFHGVFMVVIIQIIILNKTKQNKTKQLVENGGEVYVRSGAEEFKTERLFVCVCACVRACVRA